MTAERPRMITDRRNSVVYDSLQETVAARLAEQAPAPVKALTELADSQLFESRTVSDRRQRQAAREVREMVRQRSVMSVVGELAFQSMPIDLVEKIHFHDSIVSSCVEIASGIAWHGEPSKFLHEVRSVVDDVMDRTDVEQVTEVVKNEMTEGRLAAPLAELSASLERRIALAVDSTRRNAIEIDRLVEAVESEDRREALRRKLEKQHGNSLLESIFVSVRKAEGETPPDLALAESIARYTIIETLSAVGIVKMSPDEVTSMGKFFER